MVRCILYCLYHASLLEAYEIELKVADEEAEKERNNNRG